MFGKPEILFFGIEDRQSSPLEVAFQPSAWLNTFQRAHARPPKVLGFVPVELVLCWDGVILLWMVLLMRLTELEGLVW